jgi:hypothetical protein
MPRKKTRDLKYAYAAKIGFHQSIIQVYAESEHGGDSKRVSPFGKISSAFCKNVDRIDAMAALPVHAALVSRVMHSAYALACFRVTGNVDPDVADKSVMRKIFTEHDKIVSDYRKKLFSGSGLQEAWEADSKNFSEMLNTAPDTIRSGAEAVFDSQIIGTWITFETLAGDLWEKALNVHPSILAELAGSNKRISKAANTAYSKSRRDSDQETATERRISLPALARATKGFTSTGKFNKMGTILRDEGEGKFASLDNIRRSYSRAFNKDYDQLDAVLKDKCFDALAVVRNVLVHKAGFMDEEYEKNSKGLPVPQSRIGKPLELDGEITLRLTRPVIEKSGQLTEAVDSWLEKHGA